MPSKARIRPCKAVPCPNPRYGTSSLCRTHHWEKVRAKKTEAKARKLARKLSSKKHQEGERERLHKKAWKLFSEWVRRKDADPDGLITCFTCPRRDHWKKYQAGHRYHRTLDFSEDNVRPQCPQCNMQGYGGKNGNLGEYEHRLVALYGLEWSKELRARAAQHVRYETHELKAIIAELTEKLSTLKH